MTRKHRQHKPRPSGAVGRTGTDAATSIWRMTPVTAGLGLGFVVVAVAVVIALARRDGGSGILTQPTSNPATPGAQTAATTQPAGGSAAATTAPVKPTTASTTGAPTGTAPTTTAPSAAAPTATAPSVAAQASAADLVFTGRYRVGPAEAPIRIVVFTGFQCEDCALIEDQLEQLRSTRKDVSISLKHYVFNSECNPYVTATGQPDGCWLARATEAAGQLWGPEGFWNVHLWLSKDPGAIRSQATLESGLRALGYDPTGFVDAMKRDSTAQALRADIDEAERLGLLYTPMIFINGLELKGWYAPGALDRAVEAVAASNPPPRSAASDHPPTALEKYIGDWRDQPPIALMAETHTWTLGSENPRMTIVMWGDYQEPTTGEADAIIRAFLALNGDVRYIYRQYPVNTDCNPFIETTRYPLACRAAQAAEAAGWVGGNDAFWKMHGWLMSNRTRFSDETLRAATAELGLDAAALFEAMGRDIVKTNIAEDIQASQQLPSLRFGAPKGIYTVPTIFINGKFVPRWRLHKQPVLHEILSAAALQ